jgi:hypothetical protein
MSAPDGGTVPIPRAKVCVLDHPELACATTDPEGSFTLTPPGPDSPEPFAISFTAAGYLGRVRPAGHTWWPSGTGLRSDAWAEAFARQAGFTYPPQGTGFIEMKLSDGGTSRGLVGATATLSSGAGAGRRPIYADPAGRPDPSLTSTSSSGIVFFGEVTPGQATVAVQPPAGTCDNRFVTGVWPATGPNSLQLAVAPDSLTDSGEAILYCR